LTRSLLCAAHVPGAIFCSVAILLSVAEGNANVQAKADWHSSVADWAGEEYAVTAGADGLNRVYGGRDGREYRGRVIVDGTVQNVELIFVDSQPVLIEASSGDDAYVELRRTN